MNNLKSDGMSPFFSRSQKRRFSRITLALLFALTLMIVMMALPGYLEGKWKWQQAPSVKVYEQLLQLRREGLELPNWTTLSQKEMRLDNAKWSVQVLKNNQEQEMVLMLLPQGVERDEPYVMWSRPYVEWTGIDGIERWKHDQVKTLTIETENQAKVNIRFFKAWNRQTFAVIQWYAWPEGGGTHSSEWFWRDQIAQWQGQRVPWIAVNVKIPIEPLSSLEEHQELAESVVQQVQTALENQVFQSSAVP